MASLNGDHGLEGAQASGATASGLSSCGSQPLEHRLNGCGGGLNCCETCGIFLDWGSSPCPPNWQVSS